MQRTAASSLALLHFGKFRSFLQLCAKTARIRCGLRRDAACAGQRACLHATATARDMPARCDSVADWDLTDEEIQRKPPSYSAHKHWSMPRRDGHVRLSTEEDEADATEGGHPGLRRPGSAACGVNLLRWRTAMLAVAFTPWLLVLALLVEHQFAPAAHSDAMSKSSEQPVPPHAAESVPPEAAWEAAPPPPPLQHVVLSRSPEPQPRPPTLRMPPPPGPPNLRCYAQRYPDLLLGFCKNDLAQCNWPGLRRHWADAGRTEGRTFACVVEPPRPPPPPRPPGPPPPSGLPSPPPSPCPPPPRPPIAENNVLKQLHSRFHRSPDTAAWDASGTLADAGILIHVFDGWEEREEKSIWRARGGISCSLIFRDQRPRGHYSIPMYTAWASGVQGIIFRPGPTTRILCGNAADSSVGKCKVHWCPSVSLSQDTYDPARTRGDDGAAGCYGSWKPQDFGVFLRRFVKYNKAVRAAMSHRLNYNEIIVDGGHWTDSLPNSIEAFFTSDDLGRKEEQEDLAKMQHQLFLQTYSLNAAQVPLLKLDPTNWDEPFRVFDT